MNKEKEFILLRDETKNQIGTKFALLKSDKNYNSLLKLCNSKADLELMYCLKNNDSPYNHRCPICGKLCKFDISKNQYASSCRSNECLCKILLKNDKIKSSHQKIIDKYLNGGKKFTHLQIGLIEKYGVYTNSQIGGWKETMKSAYKRMTPERLKERKEKTIKTCQEKYGVDFSQQADSIRKKQSDTWHKKTKEELQEKDEKRRKTSLERYGVDHIMKSQQILEEVRQKHLKENGYYHWVQKNIEHKDIYMDDQKFKDYVVEEFHKNGDKPIKKTDLDKFFNINVVYRCTELNLREYVKMTRSPLEELLKKVFDNNNIEYEWRNRNIIDGPHGKSHCYELDFYFPEHKLGIEINDLATHSNSAIGAGRTNKTEKYHLYKTQNCKEKGIRLIHIWEWELKKNFDKTVGWILNELNDNKTRIFARKCELKEVSQEEEKKFLDEYHLQGYSKSKVCLGLYFNDELVQLMSFADSRYDKKYQYELLRLCTKNEYIVVGGASRLFKHFIKKFNPESIISYCDYSKFSGEGYEKMGMTLDKLSKPTKIYCNFDMNVINESMLMKYGVDNLLHTNYGKGADNREMIMKHGYLPVYNCGNLIYKWSKS